MKSLLHRTRLKLNYASVLLLLQFLFAQTILAQSLTVSGKVTAADSPDGIPGVTVMIKGSLQGTVTDIDGTYQLQVPDASAVLVFSSISYDNQEVTVGNQNTIDITLEQSLTALDEVVVVGYGTRKKSDITGAVTNISEK